MKSFIYTVLLIFALCVSVGADSLTWDNQDNTDGFVLYHHTAADPTVVSDLDIGDVNSYDLDTLGLNKGVRYGFFLRAYNSAGSSPESDHIMWTYPFDPIIIETAVAPTNIAITPTPL